MRRDKKLYITTNKTMADTDKHDVAQIVHFTVIQKNFLIPNTVTWLLNFSGLTPLLVCNSVSSSFHFASFYSYHSWSSS